MKLNQVHSVEARALARQMADGADGSAAAGRLWKELIRDLSAAAQAENEERHRLWSATEGRAGIRLTLQQKREVLLRALSVQPSCSNASMEK